MLAISLIAFCLLADVTRGAEICCAADGIGCFNDNPPFDNIPLPDCAGDFGLQYTMYTRDNRNVGQDLDVGEVPPDYVSSRRTVFLAHGWNSDGTSSWLYDLKDAYLDREDINVVIVDWGGGAQVLNYAQAASNTRTTGAYTARIFQTLLGVSGSIPARMWCVGHSLGSHMCGHAGSHMPSHQQIGRITGLDPAGPLFETNADKSIGLNPSCADFVDVMHTDQELGTERDIGHVDFYPTGGNDQPGCLIKDKFNDQTFHNWDSNAPEQYNICSHSRAHEFMIESVKDDCFHATEKCTDYNNLPGSCSACGGCGAFPCALMGYAAESSCDRAGMYYLTVTRSAPFCSN